MHIMDYDNQYENAECPSCRMGDHDECDGCYCSDAGHYGTMEATD